MRGPASCPWCPARSGSRRPYPSFWRMREWATVLLSPDDHRFAAGEVFHAGVDEAGLAHPLLAIGAGVVEAGRGLDQHVEAHEEALDIVAALVVDQALIDDEGAAGGQGFVGFPEEAELVVHTPVVEDVAHDEEVGRGQRLAEEIPLVEADAVLKAVFRDEVFEDRTDRAEVVPDAAEVGVRGG